MLKHDGKCDLWQSPSVNNAHGSLTQHLSLVRVHPLVSCHGNLIHFPLETNQRPSYISSLENLWASCYLKNGCHLWSQIAQDKNSNSINIRSSVGRQKEATIRKLYTVMWKMISHRDWDQIKLITKEIINACHFLIKHQLGSCSLSVIKQNVSGCSLHLWRDAIKDQLWVPTKPSKAFFINDKQNCEV